MAVASLEPFLKSARIPAHEEYRAPEPVYESIAPESEAIPAPEPVHYAEPEPEPITYSYETTAVTRAYAPEPVAQSWEPEPVRHSFQTEPVIHTSYAEPEPVAVPEPVAPSYAPVSDANVDPIQARINRALGLAVA